MNEFMVASPLFSQEFDKKKFHHEAKTVWAFASLPVFTETLIRYSSQSKLFPLSEDFGWIHLQHRVYRAFCDDVTSAILVFRNYETAAILASQNNGMAVVLVFQINLVGDELFSLSKCFSCSINLPHSFWPFNWKRSIAVAFARWIFPFCFNLIINNNKKSNRQIR